MNFYGKTLAEIQTLRRRKDEARCGLGAVDSLHPSVCRGTFHHVGSLFFCRIDFLERLSSLIAAVPEFLTRSIRRFRTSVLRIIISLIHIP